MTPYAEVIGDPIAQSKSPLIHGFWLDALGVAGAYRRSEVTSDALRDHIDRRRSDPTWRGCNVTMPHKLAVIDLVDAVDPIAARVGAVNTIVVRDGILIGYNTDVGGIAEPLKRPDRQIGAYPTHVATYAQIIGAGGAARAAGVALATMFDLEFYNRTPEKAVALAELFGLPAHFGMALDGIGPIRNPDEGPADQRYSHVIFNASSMGMTGQPPVPIDLAPYHPDTIVFDAVYAPLETPLLAAAQARGLRTIDGLEMLIAQAALAFALFFGAEPPRERDAELRAALTA
ncbi:MAG TPA: shikimate dehydrogenase [Sphingomonas sp.]|nr:shikimate dehydrogenase [Sphingomonas sp.]